MGPRRRQAGCGPTSNPRARSHVAALGACRALFPRGRATGTESCRGFGGLPRPLPAGAHDNATEVNEHLSATPVRFHGAMEDGVWQGVASALAMVHFRFPSLVDISEVAEGFQRNTRDSDMAFLMPRLEEAADVILAITPLAAILRGPSPNHKG